MWFKYLYNCVNKNIKWIDFEKEIVRVLQAFDEFFCYEGFFLLQNERIAFCSSGFPEKEEDRYILSQFNFFFEELERSSLTHSVQGAIKKEYVIEKVVGANSYYVAEDEIVSKLYMELRELADLLRDYLLYFVDEPSKKYASLKIMPHFSTMSIMPNRVYSFNYTNTVEILYGNYSVDRIHGNTLDNIVLGINPDKKDELDSVDTTFLEFKKYFQRTFFNADIDFLKQMVFKEGTSEDDLIVIGHSLDKTDEDIIKKIFESANRITILYHKQSVVKDMIRNLVEIYGKEGLDKLREEKNCNFYRNQI